MGWPRTYDVAEALLELLILSPPPNAGITGVCYHAYFFVDVVVFSFKKNVALNIF